MKNLRGIIVAALFFFLTLVLRWAAEQFGLLMGMAYPFFSKTFMEFLGAAEFGGPVLLCLVLGQGGQEAYKVQGQG